MTSTSTNANLTRSVILASVAVLSWSTVATAFKIALSHLTVFSMLYVATATALLIFAITLIFSGDWRKLGHIPARMWGVTALMGLVNPTVYYLVLFQAYDMLPAQIAQPVNYLWPVVLLVLLAIFGHQRIPGAKYIGMAVSLGGVIMISMGGKGITGSVSPAGLALCFGSAFLWALYWMLNNRFKNELPQSVSLFLSFMFGLAYLTVGSLFIPLEVPSTEGLLSGMYAGAFEMGIPFICFGIAVRITPNPALVNQMCYLAPFLSLFLISMVLGEPIMPTTYVGLALIIAGIVFNQYFASRITSHKK